MSDSTPEEKGSIQLHDRNAIGLQLDMGSIGLHKIGGGWIVGIHVLINLHHYRDEGFSSGFMRLNSIDFEIPGYTGLVQGWDYWKSVGYCDYYKPEKLQFLPGHEEFTTFAWLDEHGEDDPWFYFGWAVRKDYLNPTGYRKSFTSSHMGVNFPISDAGRPVWAEAPPEAELKKLLKPSAPDGQWRLKVSMSGFTIDPEVMQDSWRIFRVWQGRSPYYSGALDFVNMSDRVVGEKDANLSALFWGSGIKPGQLLILSGTAAGRTFRVVDSFHTGDEPDFGYPPNMWCIETHPLDPHPSSVGVTPGDEYLLTGPFDTMVFKLAEYVEYPLAGTYPAEDFDFPFTPIL